MNEQSNTNNSTSPLARPKMRWSAVMVLIGLGVIVAVVVLKPQNKPYDEDDQIGRAITQISALETALGAYEVDNGYFPQGANGLLCLIQKPPGATHWHDPYMEHSVPMDPWGHDYIYKCPGRHNPHSFDLSSVGPDGRVGVGDDICNWKQN